MNKVINFCTQHNLTDEQIKAGLYNPVLTTEEQMKLKNLMIVQSDLSSEDVKNQAYELYDLIYKICVREKNSSIHIMGQFELIHYLICWNSKLNIFQSVTDRISTDSTNPDGTITKTSKFVFKGLRQIIN